MKYVKSYRIATLRFECRKATILATKKEKKIQTRGISLKKTTAMNKKILKHCLHITFDKLDLDSSQHIRKVASVVQLFTGVIGK